MMNLRPSRTDSSLLSTLYFLARLLVLAAPLYFVLSFGVDLSILQGATAYQSSLILNSLGFPAVSEGASITIGGESPFLVLITPDSTAWKSLLFLFALVFAVPAVALKKRLLGLLLLPLVWIGNLFRVFSIVYVQQTQGIEQAVLAHDFGWQVGLTAFVLLLWVAWLWLARK